MATEAQRLARRRRRKAKAQRMKSGTFSKTKPTKGKRGPIFVNPQPVKKNKLKKLKNGGANGTSVSLVSDGVNVGSVWKNTTAERVTFPMAREKVTDLTSASTAFQLLSQLYVNPGNSTLFPIFSQIASCYEEYVPKHLKFIFRTEEYMASGSTVSAGLCAMGTNFDANDANFGNITMLENYEHSISGPPFSGIMVHDVVEQHQKRFRGKARDLSLNNYYVYPSANSIGPTTDQAKWYDLGNFQTAVNGCQAGIIGELWVEYSFTMIRRKQPEFPVGGSAIHLKSYASNATAASPLGLTPYTTLSAPSTSGGVSGTAPGSTLSVIDMSGTLANYTGSTVGLRDGVDTTLNMPNASATWMVVVQWSGGSAIAGIPAIAASGGAASLTSYANAEGLGFFLAAGTSSVITKVITTTATAVPAATSNLLTFSGNTSMAGANLDIFIIRLPTSLVTLLPPVEVEDRLAQLERMLASLLADRQVDEECKESDISLPESPGLERSVHIPRSLFAKMLSK